MDLVEDPKGMSLVVRCKQFFGLLPGQRVADFAKEYRALTSEDRAEFCTLFNQMGMPTRLSAKDKEGSV